MRLMPSFGAKLKSGLEGSSLFSDVPLWCDLLGWDLCPESKSPWGRREANPVSSPHAAKA